MKLPDNLAFDGGRLERLRPEDASAFAECARRNDARLRPWMKFGQGGFDAAFAEQHALAKAQAWDNGTEFSYAVRIEGAFAGVVSLHSLEFIPGEGSLSYWIDAAFEGRGLVTRAVRALIESAFASGEVREIEITCAPGNTRSRAVAERLGFTEGPAHTVMLATAGLPRVTQARFTLKNWSICKK